MFLNLPYLMPFHFFPSKKNLILKCMRRCKKKMLPTLFYRRYIWKATIDNNLLKWYTYFICAGMGQTRLWQGSSTCEITGSATFAMDSKQWIITSFTIRIIAWTLMLTFCCRASNSNNCLFVTQFKMQIQTW